MVTARSVFDDDMVNLLDDSGTLRDGVAVTASVETGVASGVTFDTLISHQDESEEQAMAGIYAIRQVSLMTRLGAFETTGETISDYATTPLFVAAKVPGIGDRFEIRGEEYRVERRSLSTEDVIVMFDLMPLNRV